MVFEYGIRICKSIFEYESLYSNIQVKSWKHEPHIRIWYLNMQAYIRIWKHIFEYAGEELKTGTPYSNMVFEYGAQTLYIRVPCPKGTVLHISSLLTPKTSVPKPTTSQLSNPKASISKDLDSQTVWSRFRGIYSKGIKIGDWAWKWRIKDSGSST
jgi:hypothetical protein